MKDSTYLNSTKTSIHLCKITNYICFIVYIHSICINSSMNWSHINVSTFLLSLAITEWSIFQMFYEINILENWQMLFVFSVVMSCILLISNSSITLRCTYGVCPIVKWYWTKNAFKIPTLIVCCSSSTTYHLFLLKVSRK